MILPVLMVMEIKDKVVRVFYSGKVHQKSQVPDDILFSTPLMSCLLRWLLSFLLMKTRILLVILCCVDYDDDDGAEDGSERYFSEFDFFKTRWIKRGWILV